MYEFRSMDELASFFHDEENIERILKDSAVPFLKQGEVAYRPAQAIARHGLAHAWSEVEGHKRRVEDILTIDDIGFQHKLKYGAGAVYHARKMNMRTADIARRLGPKQARDFALDHYFLTDYTAGLAERVHGLVKDLGKAQEQEDREHLRKNEEEQAEAGRRLLVRLYRFAKRRAPGLAARLDGLSPVEAYDATLQRMDAMRGFITADAKDLASTLSYIEKMLVFANTELLYTANSLGDPFIDLSSRHKGYLLRHAFSRAKSGRSVSPIATKCCRLMIQNGIAPQEGLHHLEEAVEIRKRALPHHLEDHAELAYLHMNIIQLAFSHARTFPLPHWEAFIREAEATLVSLDEGREQACRQKNASIFLSHALTMAGIFFRSLSPHEAEVLSAYGGCDAVRLEAILRSHKTILGPSLAPLDNTA